MNVVDSSYSRRQLLGALTVAATAELAGLGLRRAHAEPPPETTTLTLRRGTSLCQAPQYIAGPLLEAEGFTDVRYLNVPAVREAPTSSDRALASGEIHMMMEFAGPIILRLDAGDPIVILGGGHIGCLELFVHDGIRAVRDLRGKSVAVFATPVQVFLVTVMAHVGLDHRKDVDIRWLSQADAQRAFEERKVDAVILSPPAAQALRVKRIGRVLVNSSTDRPWSQYFCCVIVGNRDWVRKHPVATKRAMRALLKSADVCGLEPARAARMLVDGGFGKSYDLALQAMKDVPYAKWRERDSEDTVRYYALRLYEGGLIKTLPQKIVAQGTDWRFINELRKELKG